MRLLQMVSAVLMVLGMLIAVGLTSQPASAESIVVTDPSCTRDGLASAISGANPGDVITFNCTASTIGFAASEVIFVDTAITIDGGELDDEMILDGNGLTNFFHITEDGHLTLRNLVLVDGFAQQGGAIYVEDNGELTTYDVEFGGDPNVGLHGNVASFNGGAIFNDAGGTVTLHDGTVTFNTAMLAGGAILTSSNSTLIIDDVTFGRNKTDNPVISQKDAGGGAILGGGGATITITDSWFDKNSSSEWHGGAIYISDSTLTITNSAFSNQANQQGGSIFCDSSTIDIERSTFNLNEAGDLGGALSAHSCDIDISQSQFAYNDADQDGGAIYSSNDSSIDIVRSNLYDNNAGRSGGAIASDFASLSINATTFAKNTADSYGGDVLLDRDIEDTVTISWSTFVQEVSRKPSLDASGGFTLTGVLLGGPGEHCDLGAGTLTDSYTMSNSEGCGLDGTGSAVVSDLGLAASASAIYVNEVQQFYFPLEADSPAINAGPEGGCETLLQEGVDTDQIGTTRPINVKCDIGAIEAGNIPPVISSVLPTPGSTINEGESVTLLVSITDQDSPPASITTEIDCDTSDPTSPILPDGNQTCAYPDDGSYTGLVTASDGLASNTKTFTIEVNNVSSVIQPLTIGGEVGLNTPVTFQMIATDVPADTITFSYTCADGASVMTTDLVTSTTGTFTTTGSCTYTTVGLYTIRAWAVDDDNGVSNYVTATVEAIILTNLCAADANGQLRMVDSEQDCGRSESLIQLPADPPLLICVNRWNGATSLGPNCGRSEHQLTIYGDGSIAVCVNKWNGVLRVSDWCSRSEREDWL